ncbi:Peptidase family M1 [Amycolatopsis arida]|uniref:Aminopeptidase N n=1 Tax=Amycolatopsis arida TaxID=587909 RepID=A0A1I6A7K4_9PSEU|nr:M1 family metallopeptidase [Amycolatopsis arida]TDX88547.1 peptidase M1-like protein [Amycolatopsis arida]SFQ64658.1 Peptidase family M1 [Amycolatopsis arida]
MRSRTRTGFGAVAAGLATVLLSTTASAAPAPGSAGVGDPYYPGAGNGGYDVAHYDIRLTYQPDTDRLAGTTTILATTTQELSSFNLDFGLDVRSVRVNNAPARFATDPADPSELVVTPARPLARGQFLAVVVTYADTPSQVEIGGVTAWKKTPDGALAVDEPQISEWWFPANDHPTDKATYDVSVEVPDDVAALSNGTLVRTSKQRAGWTRWNWRSTEPQATYLTLLAVGRFEVLRSTTPSGQPFVTAYDPALGPSLPAAKASIERTPEVVKALEEFFGPYPFEAQGGVASTGLGFALENQTRSVYGRGFFRAGTNMSVVAHENAHQWFGDSVSVGSWRDIWLNEGFASYAEFLWSEHVGEGTADELAEYLYNSYPADDAFWRVPPGDPGAENQFHVAVYDRGAMAVHALREAVGDEAFFRILRTWLETKKGGHGTIPEFVALAERLSGVDLDGLIRTWLYTPAKPAVSPNGHGAEVAAARAPRTERGALVEPKSYRQIRATHELLHAPHGH